MASFYRLFLLLLAFHCLPVHALVPKQSVTGYTVGGGSPIVPTARELCPAQYPLVPRNDGYACDRSPSALIIVIYRVTVQQCPANSTASGTQCACNSGYVQDASATSCIVPDPCELLADMCSGSQGMSTNFSLPGRKTGVSFTCMAPTAIGTNDPLSLIHI